MLPKTWSNSNQFSLQKSLVCCESISSWRLTCIPIFHSLIFLSCRIHIALRKLCFAWLHRPQNGRICVSDSIALDIQPMRMFQSTALGFLDTHNSSSKPLLASRTFPVQNSVWHWIAVNYYVHRQMAVRDIPNRAWPACSRLTRCRDWTLRYHAMVEKVMKKTVRRFYMRARTPLAGNGCCTLHEHQIPHKMHARKLAWTR